jgi:hypothetical protein
VAEKTGSGESLIEKIFNSEIGSVESRAAARRLVEEPTKAPNLLLIFVNPHPRGDFGEPIGPVQFNSHTATLDGTDKKLFLIENESQEAFEQRVADSLPAVGLPGIAFLFPND